MESLRGSAVRVAAAAQGRHTSAAATIPVPTATGGPVAVVLARHGSTAWTHPVPRFQGRVDIPLSARGRLEAMRLATALSETGVVSIWHSPLARAAETAGIVARHLRLPLRCDDRLVEMSFGSWEGRSHDSVKDASPALLHGRRADPLGITPPGGESVGALIDRVAAVAADLGRRGEAPRAVIAHEGVIRAFAVCLGLSAVEDFYSLVIPCGAALELRPRRTPGYDVVMLGAGDGAPPATDVQGVSIPPTTPHARVSGSRRPA